MATFALSSSTPYPTLDGAPCPARGWRRIPPPVIRRQSQNQWLNDPLLVHLVRRGSTRTGLSRNHSHLTGGVVANVVVRTADYVRGGDLYGFWPIGARWVRVGGCQCVVGAW